jgi:hypothetical protein
MSDDLRTWLATRGWELDGADEPCWLDHAEPGYRKEWTDSHGTTWEIFLCPEDARVLESGAYAGNYRGALTPSDSRAQAWPWMQVSSAVAG